MDAIGFVEIGGIGERNIAMLLPVIARHEQRRHTGAQRTGIGKGERFTVVVDVAGQHRHLGIDVIE